MPKCNCFEEKLNQISDHLKEKLSPEITEFYARWEGEAMLFSGEGVPATLGISYPICGQKVGEHTQDSAVMVMRNAIQVAEEFGLIRTESGQVITGAVTSEDGIVLVKE